jgi:hypothetical protein
MLSLVSTGGTGFQISSGPIPDNGGTDTIIGSQEVHLTSGTWTLRIVFAVANAPAGTGVGSGWSVTIA